jgi:hypothetical protein
MDPDAAQAGASFGRVNGSQRLDRGCPRTTHDDPRLLHP